MAATATVVGGGPNGLAAAVTLARAGMRVRVLEAAPEPGGAARTAELTAPGFRHDLGSAVHPAALTSPFFRAFGLRERVEWIIPDASYAHVLDANRSAIAWRDLDRTVEELGVDGAAWRSLVGALSWRVHDLAAVVSGAPVRVPPFPGLAAGFLARALVHGSTAGRSVFRSEHAAALLTGVFAHANAPLPSPAAAAAGLFLAAHAHASDGWAFPRGGAQRITDALVRDLTGHGGQIIPGERVDRLDRLDWGDPDSGDLLMLATTPRLLLTHPRIPSGYARALRRYRYGAAVAKIDLALSGPVPWADIRLRKVPTVHLGGTRAQIEVAERAVARGRIPADTYAIVVQPSVLDDTRAPTPSHTLWAYTHVPRGSVVDPTEPILAQLERAAPGVRDLVLHRAVTTAVDWPRLNPAAIGGDVFGGAITVRQLLARPVPSATPWRTALPGVYLASSSAAPGPGVTGMPGWHAARQALTDLTGVGVTLDDLFPPGEPVSDQPARPPG